MSFTSLPFLGLLAAAAAAYYLLPKRARWAALLGASYVFYCAGGVGTVAYLLLTTATTYAAGLLLARLSAADGADRQRRKRQRKAVVFCALFFNFAMLFALKYLNDTLALLGGGSLSSRLPELVLPLGVSFYVFQSAGYVVDCYRGMEPQRSLPKYALFVSFFPQLVQGPIGRYRALAPQLLEGNDFSADRLKYGIQLMLWGYLKKMVVAERAGVLVNTVFGGYTFFGGAIDALGVLFYCVQLYCDFSGGIDIARGAAQLFGVELAENFRRPIFATSLADYWRRWHITLGQWMRDYVFYPLSLSRPFARLGRWSRRAVGGKAGKLLPTSLATFVIYFIIGIWHGMNFRYIFFGCFNGAIITLSLLLDARFLALRERLGIPADSRGLRAFRMARTSLIVFVGRYITRAPRLMTAFWMLAHLLVYPQFHQLTDGTVLTLGLSAADLWIVALGQAAILAVEAYQERGGHVRAALETKPWAVQWLAMLLMCGILLFLGILRGSYIPAGFIYQQF